MKLDIHNIVNKIFYWLCILWGVNEIIEFYKYEYLIIFIVSFIYSGLIRIIYIFNKKN
jgi:hypothetical protein